MFVKIYWHDLHCSCSFLHQIKIATEITSNKQDPDVYVFYLFSQPILGYGSLLSLKTQSFAARGYLTRFNRDVHPLETSIC